MKFLERTVRSTLIAAVLIAFCSGCAVERKEVVEGMTVSEAKERTQAVESQIAGLVPAEFKGRVDQLSEGTFLGCRDGGNIWSGYLTVAIVGDPSPDSVLGPVESAFAGTAGFSVASRRSFDDSVVDVRSSLGEVWVVRYRRDKAVLSVNSGSACVRLPEDVWPGGSY